MKRNNHPASPDLLAPEPELVQEWQEELQLITRTGRLSQHLHRAPADAFERLGIGADFHPGIWAALNWYGPIEPWRDPAQSVSDIFHNGERTDSFFLIQRGMLVDTQVTMHPGWVMWLQEQLLLRAHKLPVHAEGAVAAWPRPAIQSVADGLRFAVTVPPRTRTPSIAIRLLPEQWRTLDDLVIEQVLTTEAAALLREALRCGVSVLVTGATGSGKTTLAAALIGAISAGRRLIFIEDGSELPRQDNSVHHDVGEGGPVAFAEAIRFALRQKPDYIVVGEVRGGEAMAMLQAAATGHPGIGTIHANSVQAALRNLERNAMLGVASEASGGGDAAAQMVRSLIAADIPLLVVHVGTTSLGRRSVLAIEEVLLMGAQGRGGDPFTTGKLFCFDTHRQALVRTASVQREWGYGRL